MTLEELSASHPEVGNVIYPVPDVSAAVEYYRDALGLPVKFVDGSRFAALDGGTVTFALVDPVEDVAGGAPAASLRVADVMVAVSAAVDAGGTIARAAETGPHEVRAVVRDPWGNAVVFYAPLNDVGRGSPNSATTISSQTQLAGELRS